MERFIQLLAFMAVFFIHGSSSVVWEPLGCFKDSSDRAMGHYFTTITYNKDSRDFKDMFQQCRRKTEENGYTYFGIQNMEECWGSKNARETYDKHGCVENCRRGDDGYGAGGKWSNFVYRVKQDWTKCYKKQCLQYKLSLVPDTRPKCPSYNKKVQKTDVTRTCPNKGVCTCKVFTTNGKCCVFPFIYQGKSYDTCLRKWCATTPNYDKDKQYGWCILNGGWSEYSEWSECSKTCEGGTQTRTRTCTNPAPLNGGNNCVGDSTESRSCNTKKCPPCKVHTTNGKCCVFPFIYQGKSYHTCLRKWCATTPNYDKDKQYGWCILNGGWSEYSEWSECSKTCEGGTQTRTRTCTNPAPLNGGENCVGESTESRSCNTKKCPPCKVHTTNGKCCVFPFIYQGKSYDTCLRKWCATTPNYDKDKQYGWCVSK